MNIESEVNKMQFNWKTALIIFIAMIFGYALGRPSEETQAEPQPQVDVSTWKELKTIDDRGFVLAGEGMNSCSRILGAVSEGNVEAMERENNNILEITEEMVNLSERRMSLLSELGY